MMKRIVSLLYLCLTFAMAMSQKLTVDNFALAPQDLTASTQRRNDNNGQACALIKVQLARPGATFHGNVMGDTPYSQSEYFVYMSKGSKMLQVKLDGYLPVMIDFEKDWGIKGVESLTTYVLSITLPNIIGQMDDDGKTYFTLTVSPPNTIVKLDGVLYNLDTEGRMKERLLRGVHHYELSSKGYATKTGSFTLGTEKLNLQETLVSAKAKLVVTCVTSGVDLFVDEEKVSSGSSWEGSLDPGSYLIEARKDGYISQRKSVTLAENQTLEVNLPALIAKVGQLDVNYTPFDAEVWIDGKKAGTAPDLFKNLTLGNHKVEIRKEGYQSEMKTVTIAEGQMASLSGSLPALTSSTSTATVTSTTGTTTSSSSSQAKQTFTVNGVSFTMVRVEGGTFTMGAEQGSDADSDEKPAHQVTLSTYSIGETEVTQELWQAVMGSNPSNFKGAKRPVESVSWDDCQEFIKKLNENTGKTFRLPTEAEWEYAARGGSKSKGFKYAGSNSIETVAWYIRNSYDKGKSSTDYGTHNVAQKQPNELGLYDMSGNVWEWCSDWHGSYSSGSQMNPQGANSGRSRQNRGGSWYSIAGRCRSSCRNSGPPDFRLNFLGLRLVLSE